MRIPFSMPDIKAQDKKSVLDVLNSQWLTGGLATPEFENKFAQYIGVKHAIAVSSCTSGLHLAMRALGIKSRNEVIVPTLTFVATANAPIFCGAKPVFADIDEDTFCISPKSIRSQITNLTRAIIVVHYGGTPCNMYDILKIAEDNDLCVVEDCAHSLGSTYDDIQTGGLADIGVFSFYPTKNLTTGEGGMVTTNNDYWAKHMRQMRSHCMTKEAKERSESGSWYYDVTDLGYNYRMSELQAGLGISQLVKLDERNKKRAEIAKFYTSQLKEVNGIIPPSVPVNCVSSNHLYVIRVIEKEYGINRDELFKKLAEKGIECSVHYTPIHKLSYYRRRYDINEDDYPITNGISHEIISLPLYSRMQKWQAEYVIESIRESCAS